MTSYTIPNVIARDPRGERIMDVYSHLLILQRHSCSGEWVAAASVMGESGLVLSASSESGPGPDMVGPVVTGEDEGDEQAADLG
ncbi:hypothetical protein GCM10010198_06540 [Nocardia seriolae]|nr:Clp protease ClpP [Nocardia seriolae]BEK85980.1 hypothetical protein NSERKGN1266_19310 [Nocardia seriolae]BEK98082.1 hypothetical protein NSER024013_59880 [Nocardia seriolae]